VEQGRGGQPVKRTNRIFLTITFLLLAVVQGRFDQRRAGECDEIGTPLATVFPNTGIGQQLAQVAKIIQVRGALGMDRQILFASMGGFDTHAGLVRDPDPLMQQLDGGIGASRRRWVNWVWSRT
jgi:uncharacterized protein (DUF1501 family)